MNEISERDILAMKAEELEQQAKRKSGLLGDNELAQRITEGFKKRSPVPSWEPVHMPDPLPILSVPPFYVAPIRLKRVGKIFRGPGRY